MLAAGVIHQHRVAVVHATAQQHARQLVADLALHEASQRAGTIRRIVAGAGQPFARRIRHIERDAAFGQTRGHLRHLDVDDAAELLARQRVEDHQLIQTVDELRLELHVHGVHHGLALGVLVQIGLDQELRAQVRGHDQDRVLEVHGAALTIGQTAVVEHLQKHVEDLRVRLLHLVEQHHRIRAATHGLGQLTALLIPDVARRRADQAGHGGLLHVLAHIDAHHGLLVVEQEVGERLGELGLAHTGGAEEQERAGRAVRVGDAGARTAHRVGHGLDGLLLADDALAEVLLHVQELLVLALHEAADGDAGPVGDDLRHGIGVHMVGHHRLGGLTVRVGLVGRPFGRGELLLNRRDLAVQDAAGLLQVALSGGLVGFHALGVELGAQVADLVVAGLLRVPTGGQAAQLLARVGQFGLQLAQTLLGRGVLGLLQLHLLHLQTGDLALQFVDLLGLRVKLHAQVGGGLVDQVDGLVRQLTAGDVPVRQRGGGDQRVVADRDLVVRLVPLLQTTQDGNRVLDGWLAHVHLLEAAFQRRVLLHVLAVFVERGGADQTEFAARQHGLQHIAGVHRAFGRAGADDRVDLVDERDDLAVRVLDLVEHALEALLEFAAVLGAGHHGAQVQRDQLLVLQGARHVAGHDALRQAFHDGGFADAGLADQHRVVFGAPAQDLDDAANLLVAADHRVELAIARLRGQIGGVLLQRLVVAFGVRAGDLRAAAHAGHGLAQRLGGDAVALEDVGALVRGGRGDADEQVFGRDVFVTHRLHFLLGLRERGGQLTAGLRLRGARTAGARQRDQRVANLSPDALAIAAGGLDQAGDHAVLLAEQRIHQMQGLDLRVARGGRALDRVADCLLGHRRELLFHIILHASRPAAACCRAVFGRDSRCLIWSTDHAPILFPKLE